MIAAASAPRPAASPSTTAMLPSGLGTMSYQSPPVPRPTPYGRDRASKLSGELAPARLISGALR